MKLPLTPTQVIVVGSKFVSFSSSILGPHTDGIPPLQAKESLKLKLNYNAVRPALWHAKLGYTGECECGNFRLGL